ncbi:histidine kinase [Anaeromyxobacter sp. K]|uniref:sensor histidine kinase n=1 Tax=Anaeromyxobacter sp. (strain K) TaxID=447217 RepID=UPI00015F9BD7|nr:HAMP domain-containing sensor histidine kinase [Anaeromyxobacter sp. K]ACG71509.1 histidine kinase [Anaeromyxobacter sp. K]
MAPHDAPGQEAGQAAQAQGRVDLLRALDRLLAIEPEEHALRRILSALADAVPAVHAAVLLVPGDEGRLAIAAEVGGDGRPPPPADGGAGLAAGAPWVRHDPGWPLAAGARAGAAAPAGGGALLVMGTRGEGGFDPEALALLRVAADRAGLALERGRLRRAHESAEEAARRALAEVDSRRRAVDYILGIVGHDLRNPLGAVHMSAALLQKRGGLEGWQARAIERMRSSAGRMARIIADLLSYTRTRLGNGMPIDRRPARLDEIARRPVDELGAVNPGREITVEVRGDVSGSWDPDRLEQVISNLVSNAVDHGDPASPVRVELVGEPDACVLRVRNTGPPVPPEVLEHLFEPFSRPPDEKSRKGSGLGLGLYISREIVRGHGGEISIASDGETVITARLPRSQSPAP